MNVPDSGLKDDRSFSGMSWAEVGGWVRRLRYFRLCKAYGGHANDGDHLLAALRYADNVELSQLLAELRLPLLKDWTMRYQSPGRVRLAGQPVYVSVRDTPTQQLEFSLADPEKIYEVTPRVVAAAQAVEEVLVPYESRVVDPPQADSHCICPTYHPDLWVDGA